MLALDPINGDLDELFTEMWMALGSGLHAEDDTGGGSGNIPELEAGGLGF